MRELDRFPDFVARLTAADIPFDGVNAWMVRDDRSQVVFLEFDDDTEVPAHAHQEQWELVLSGNIRLCRDGEWEEFSAGENFFVPAGVTHSAKVTAGYRAIIFFNEPDRYLPRRS